MTQDWRKNKHEHDALNLQEVASHTHSFLKHLKSINLNFNTQNA